MRQAHGFGSTPTIARFVPSTNSTSSSSNITMCPEPLVHEPCDKQNCTQDSFCQRPHVDSAAHCGVMHRVHKHPSRISLLKNRSAPSLPSRTRITRKVAAVWLLMAHQGFCPSNIVTGSGSRAHVLAIC
ncbi:hypothetical protein PILCRDRAFT_822173 [Piloderma croceum F 1598]|uniref:Uncharacterized protein n=1 Tax=Piloderma croceum (strain F 1598) TaxID=765440 RepID=A0A0C3FM77_PILCF|nr:hypothetical protein PILCRDRAFT_822173 [Piloderma croceum F 1598]